MYSAEYQAVLDRATALGYTHPSPDQKTKQNKLVHDLKDAGIWDLLDVFYVFATDGSSDFATLNWKAPSANQATKVNTPTFTANLGFTGNGTSSYLNTNWEPSTKGVNFTQDNAACFTYLGLDLAVNSTVDYGSNASTPTRTITQTTRTTADGLNLLLNTGTFTAMTNTNAIGFYHNKRTSSTAIALIKDGVVVSTQSQTSSGIPPLNVYLLARNNAGTAGNFSANRMGVFGAGASLNAKESDLYTAWNTYFTSL
jgi:hypothetical protein